MSETKNAWVRRVLGVDPENVGGRISPSGDDRSRSGQSAVSFATARDALRDASESVDGQIAALARALRASGDEELEEISGFGMNALTGGHKVPLMAALMELGSGSPEHVAKSGAKALRLVRAFRQHLETDERIAVCDDNPAGVPVSIRATLVPALATLEAALAAAWVMDSNHHERS
jgi:hypothetical protein